jgi:ubiquinone biosynthesis monooxygenase Coq7
MDKTYENEATAQMPKWLLSALRTDHAGETGAVWIYKGILSVSGDKKVIEFATRHLETEQEHLKLLESTLDVANRTKLLPLWRLAGFVIGAAPALIGPSLVWATIEAVETFVVDHYEKQIKTLIASEEQASILELLRKCSADEAEHCHEAQSLQNETQRFLTKLWCRMVSLGSLLAVKISARV